MPFTSTTEKNHKIFCLPLNTFSVTCRDTRSDAEQFCADFIAEMLAGCKKSDMSNVLHARGVMRWIVFDILNTHIFLRLTVLYLQFIKYHFKMVYIYCIIDNLSTLRKFIALLITCRLNHMEKHRMVT